ncbi:MAG: hypothetical protein HGA37_11915 [Lentimicrobium sp.]|nr:hypothetical protein [Lentimicrobium sp.]
MDNFDAQHPEPVSPVLLNDEAIKALSETRKWTNFFSILGIIGIVIILFAAVIMAFVLPSLNEEAGQDVSPVFIGLLYLIFSALYLLPVIYLFRFGSMMKKAIAESSNQLMGAAFKNLSLHFRTVGIITIVFISFYILAILLMLIFGMGMFAGDLFKA